MTKPGARAIDFQEIHRRLDQAEGRLAREGMESDEERRALLLWRTEALARAFDTRQVEGLEVVAFSVGGERYAVPISQVVTVVPSKGLIPLPGSPEHVLGGIAVRASMVAVIDLRHLLGLSGGGMTDLTRVVVVRMGEEEVGLAVDLMEGRTELAKDNLHKPDTGPFLWISSDRLAVLDLKRLEENAPSERG
jgi:purine-binding chemotaxis protein CheW